MDINSISALVIDVDGVLTDGGLHYGVEQTSGPGAAEQSKTFCVQDGVAVKLWCAARGRVAVLSGRTSPSVAARGRELGIEMIVQGSDDKLAAFERICAEWSLDPRCAAYMGDDLPDVAPLRRCGFPIAPANAVPAVKRVAQFITQRRGGDGAVREAVEWLLCKQQRWKNPATPASQSEIGNRKSGIPLG
ncbi:MAG TPA: HAD hydrolase family protein [Phycisphaerae bacterium]|jgi:3-deoxy-D-manno-octulosonate 8-phosphate phosphatase (KDO 8-P phosphatase)